MALLVHAFARILFLSVRVLCVPVRLFPLCIVVQPFDFIIVDGVVHAVGLVFVGTIVHLIFCGSVRTVHAGGFPVTIAFPVSPALAIMALRDSSCVSASFEIDPGV